VASEIVISTGGSFSRRRISTTIQPTASPIATPSTMFSGSRQATSPSEKLPETTNGVTVSRYCSSSLDAIRHAANAIKAGEGDTYIAAGVEWVSRYNERTEAAGADDQNERLFRTRAFFVTLNEKTIKNAMVSEQWLRLNQLGRHSGGRQPARHHVREALHTLLLIGRVVTDQKDHGQDESERSSYGVARHTWSGAGVAAATCSRCR